MTSPTLEEGGSAKRWRYSISLISKMGDKGEGGVKNLKNWVTSFMDGSIQYINSDHWKKYLRFLLGFVFALKIFLQYTLQILLHRLLLLLYSSKKSFMRLSFLRLGRQKIKRYYTLQISWLDKYYVLTVLFLILIYSPNIFLIMILNKKSWAFWTYTIDIISVKKISQ